MSKLELSRRIVHWLLTAATIVFIISGLGITEFRTVEPLTFGLLGKNVSFKLHLALTIPFLALLLAHIGLVIAVGRQRAHRK